MMQGGILNVNKPSHLTSFRVVSEIRKILNEKKVGHCGTLDPIATGVLVILFGSATAYSNELMSKEKVYRVEMLLGAKTDSGDVTGQVIRTAPPPLLNRRTVEQAFQRFTGEIVQLPPMFSAIKFKGKKLYEYARQKIEVERPARKVKIFSIRLIRLLRSAIEFRLVCSKGTYVRSLVEDLGEFLGVPATVKSLIRERSGEFYIEESLDWDELVRMSRRELISRAIRC